MTRHGARSRRFIRLSPPAPLAQMPAAGYRRRRRRCRIRPRHCAAMPMPTIRHVAVIPLSFSRRAESFRFTHTDIGHYARQLRFSTMLTLLAASAKRRRRRYAR